MVNATPQLLAVKQEAGGAAARSTDTPNITPTPEPEDPHKRTVEALKFHPKNVLRSTSDTIISIKQMFERTQDGKYTKVLNEDLGKILPKFIAHFKAVERFICEGNTSDETKSATVYALATKLDKDYEVYNSYREWFVKMNPSKPPKKAKKDL